MAVSIDARPTYFGDRMIVTGTYAAGDTSIDLSSLMSTLDAFVGNSAKTQITIANRDDGDPGTPNTHILEANDVYTISGTTVTVVGPDGGAYGGGNAGTAGGTFLAIGRRS